MIDIIRIDDKVQTKKRPVTAIETYYITTDGKEFAKMTDAMTHQLFDIDKIKRSCSNCEDYIEVYKDAKKKELGTKFRCWFKYMGMREATASRCDEYSVVHSSDRCRSELIKDELLIATDKSDVLSEGVEDDS